MLMTIVFKCKTTSPEEEFNKGIEIANALNKLGVTITKVSYGDRLECEGEAVKRQGRY